MIADDWQNIEKLFHAALSLSGDERETYLSRTCAGRQSVRAQVESLLASFERQNSFLEQPAFSLGMNVLEREVEISLTGKEIGPYKILDKLGSGGMGDVYLAQDTRLNRQVALKFLSSVFVDDKRAKRQLMREARAVAMLDHPNICPVFGFDEIEEYSFIVMQFVEGDTLSRLIRQGALVEGQKLSIGRQITEALAAAHARGIVHRDIKTGNIMVTPGGQVKVLDFGLAKVLWKSETAGGSREISQVSRNGLIAGTVAYMSPEQLRGEVLDFRTDIFSLGAVFCELFSGQHPFSQDSDAETISAILTMEHVLLNGEKSGIGPKTRRIIKKCLEKDRDRRYTSATDLLSDLQNLPNEKPMRRPTIVQLLTIFIFFALLTVFGGFLYKSAARTRSLAILPFVNQTNDARNDYISAMTETFIYRISNSSQISVKPFALVANFSGDSNDPLEVGRSLNVDAVMTGKTTTNADNEIVLETKLINIHDGSSLLIESDVLSDSDNLRVQEKIAEKVISVLQPSFRTVTENGRPIHYTQNPQAHAHYLRGLSHWRLRDSENIDLARDAFLEAIKFDNGFAQAYAHLAFIYIVRPSVNYKALTPKESIKLARTYAQDAIRIDPNLSEAHAALGVIYHKYEWNWQDAEKEYRLSIALNPQAAQTYYWYAELLSVTGRKDEAISTGLKAREVDRFSPLMDLQVGRVLYYARQFSEAESQLTDAINKYPNHAGLKLILGLVYLQEDKSNEAIRLFEEIYASDKKSFAATLGYAYGKLGRKADALRILNELNEMEKNGFLPAHEKALVYIGLNDNENTFIWLEKAYEEPFFGLPVLNVDPVYDNLRDDKRFQDLLGRTGLETLGTVPPIN